MKHLISQSEVDAYLSCKRKHYYSFGMPIVDSDTGVESHGIQPKSHSVSLSRGIVGHAVLDTYYNSILAGDSHAMAVQNSNNFLAEQIASADSPLDIQLLVEISEIVGRYFNHYEDEGRVYEPLAVEKEFRYEVSDTLVFPFKPDLVKRDRFTGEIILVDHKFVYNFYQERSLPIMPQTSKYVYALNALGYEVSSAEYNQISTRKNSKTPFNRQPIPLKPTKMQNFWKEQIQAMEEIEALKEGSVEEWEAKALRTASAFNCTNCPFLDICVAELEETNGIDLLIDNFFMPNKYGYGKDEDGVF